MIKGRAIIELTNVNTGEVQTIEEENYITDLIKDCMQNNPYFGSIKNHLIKNNYTATNFLNTLINGIILFDDSLGDDPSKYHFHSGVNMVGRGDESAYTGNDTTMGSYNTSESEDPVKLEAGRVFKRVWDFSTTQANGTIGSICLCSPSTARFGAGMNYPQLNGIKASHEYFLLNNEYYRYIVNRPTILNQNRHDRTYIDWDNMILYCMAECNIFGGKNDNTVKIDSYDISDDKVNIFDGWGLNRKKLILLESNTYTLPNELTDIVSNATQGAYVLDIDSGNLIITIMPTKRRISNTDKICDWKINMKTQDSTAEIFDNPFADVENCDIGYHESTYTPNWLLDTYIGIINKNDYILFTKGIRVNGDYNSYKKDGLGIYCLNKNTKECNPLTYMDGTEIVYSSLGDTVYHPCLFRDLNAQFYIGNSQLLIIPDNANESLFRYMDRYGSKNIDDNIMSGLILIDMSTNSIKFLNYNQNSPSSIFNFDNWNRYTGWSLITMTNNNLIGRIGDGVDQIDPWSVFYPFVLTTINNLETPITKTDEQMMKITYELTLTE